MTEAHIKHLLDVSCGDQFHPSMAKALDLAEKAVISAPFDPIVRYGLAEVQILTGNLCKAKLTVNESKNLGMNLKHETEWPEIKSKPFSDFPVHKYKEIMDLLVTTYQELIYSGFGDSRIRFYLLNLSKLRNNFLDFSLWLDNEDLNDEFYLLYSKSSDSDFFFAERRCWIQQRFFQRITEVGERETLNELFPEYFRCIAYDVEWAISSTLFTSSNESEKTVDLDTIDEKSELTQFFWLQELTITCQGHSFCDAGDIHSALACFDAAESLSSARLSTRMKAGILFGKSRIQFALLNVEMSRILYQMTSVEAANKNAVCEQRNLPPFLQPTSIQADSFAGLAACERLLLRPDDAQKWALKALDCDPACGDAVRQLTLVHLDRGNIALAATMLVKLVRRDSGFAVKEHREDQPMRFTASNPRFRKKPSSAREGQTADGDLDHVWTEWYNFVHGVISEADIGSLAAAVKYMSTFPPSWDNYINIGEFTKLDTCLSLLARGKWFLKRGMIADTWSSVTAALNEVQKDRCGLCDKIALSLKCLWKRHKLFLLRGNAQQALEDLQISVDLLNENSHLANPAKKMSKINFARGIIFFKLEDSSSAEQAFLAAIDQNPGMNAAKGYLGLLYSTKNSSFHERAISLIKEYLEALHHSNSTPNGSVLLTYTKLLSGLAHDKNSAHEVMNVCSRVLEQNPNDSDALLQRAASLMLLERWNAAVLDYTSAISSLKDPGGLASAYYHRGRAFQKMERFHLALRDFDDAKERGFKEVHLAQNMALCYEALGQFENAVKWHGEVLTGKDVDRKVRIVSLNQRAALYTALNQYCLAVKDFDILSELTQLSPDCSKILYQRGCVRLREWFDTKSGIDPWSDHDIHQSSERPTKSKALLCAISDFDSVLTANPGHLGARLKRADAFRAVHGDMPNDQAILEMTMAVEKGSYSKINLDFLCWYSVLLSEELSNLLFETLPNGNRGLSFNFINQRQSQNAIIEFLVESNGRLYIRDSNVDDKQTEWIFVGHLQTTRLERKTQGDTSFFFEIHSDIGRALRLGSRKLIDRERLFMIKQAFLNKADGSFARFAKPLQIFEYILRFKPRHLVSLNCAAILKEQNKEFNQAIKLYISALDALYEVDYCVHPDASGSSSIYCDWEEIDHESLFHDQHRINALLIEPNERRYSDNILRSSICFRLGKILVRNKPFSCMDNKKLIAAMTFFEYAHRNDSKHLDSLFYLGWLSLKLERFEDSARWYELLLLSDPNCAKAYNNLGVTKEMQGCWDIAMSLYCKAEKMEPQNTQYVCNMYMLKIRADVSCSAEVIEKMTRIIDSTSSSKAIYFPYLVRGIAYHVRGSERSRGAVRSEVRGDCNATTDYLKVLMIDPNCFQARIMLAHKSITDGNLSRARVDMKWIETHHRRSEIATKLKYLAMKVEMLYSTAVADFMLAVNSNPIFQTLNFEMPNVDVSRLRLSMDDVSSTRQGNCESNLMTSVQHIQAAFHSNDLPKVIEESTKLAALCKRDNNAMARILACRALALSELNRPKAAAADTKSALKCISLFPDLGDDNCSRRKSITTPKTITDHEDLSNSTSFCKMANIDFAYSLLCLLGSTFEANIQTTVSRSDDESCEKEAMDNFVNSRKAHICYQAAVKLIPDRIEAFLNIANVCRKAGFFEDCIEAYVKVLACMANDQRSVCSPMSGLQESLHVVMSEYYSNWKDVFESTVLATSGNLKTQTTKDIDRLQSEMLWLRKEIHKSQCKSQNFASRNKYQASRRDLIRIADRFTKIICNRPQFFSEECDVAVKEYSKYQKALNEVVHMHCPGIHDELQSILESNFDFSQRNLSLPSISEVIEIFKDETFFEGESLANALFYLKGLGAFAEDVLESKTRHVLDRNDFHMFDLGFRHEM